MHLGNLHQQFIRLVRSKLDVTYVVDGRAMFHCVVVTKLRLNSAWAKQSTGNLWAWNSEHQRQRIGYNAGTLNISLLTGSGGTRLSNVLDCIACIAYMQPTVTHRCGLCWAHWWAVQKRVNQSICHLGLTHVGPWIYVSDRGQDSWLDRSIHSHEGWQVGNAAFCHYYFGHLFDTLLSIPVYQDHTKETLKY